MAKKTVGKVGARKVVRKVGANRSKPLQPVFEDPLDLTGRVTYTDEGLSNRCTMLITGFPKTGKTHLAGTAPNTFWLNIDLGTRTVSHLHRPKIDTFMGDPAYQMTLMTANSLLAGVEPFGKQIPEKIETVVIDDLSRLCTLMEEEIVANPPEITGDNLRKETLFLSDYNLIKRRIARIVNSFKRLNLNVVMIADLLWQKDERLGETVLVPDFSGNKIGPIVPHYFDMVIRMYEDKHGNFCCQIRGSDRFPYAGVRIPGGLPEDCPERLVMPTWKDLIKVYENVTAKVIGRKKGAVVDEEEGYEEGIEEDE